jgi:quercetin dioxygenase-like cupin family protein
MAQVLAVARLYTDDADVTHFVDEGLAWNVSDSSPTATDLFPAKQIGFLRIPAGYRSDWHPAPRLQYVMVMNGSMEVEAGDGERRVFEPGSVLLVSDTQGKGHRTNVIGDQEVLLVWVPVPAA